MRRSITAILKERPDMLFDIMWPSNMGDWKYYKDGFFDHPNIKRTPMYIHPKKMLQVVSFESREWMEVLDYKRNYYDVIWNHIPEIGDILKFSSPTYDDYGKNRVINFHYYILHRSLPYPIDKAYAHIVAKQLTGSIFGDVNVFISDWCKEMLFDNANEYLSPDKIARIEERSQIIPFGCYDLQRFDQIAAETKKAKIFTFAYNHRLQAYKNWEDTFAQFTKLWRARKDKFRVRVFGAISGDNISRISALPFVDSVDTLTDDKYLRSLAECHANVTHSQHETFCLSATDSMMFGQPLIAPKAVTFPQITGYNAGNNYPLLYANEKQCFELMKRCVDDPKFTTKWGSVARDHVRSEYSSSQTAKAIIDIFESGYVACLPGLKRRKEWEALIFKKDIWDSNELRQVMYRAYSDIGKRIASSQSFPLIKIKRVANELGYQERWSAAGLEIFRSPQKSK